MKQIKLISSIIIFIHLFTYCLSEEMKSVKKNTEVKKVKVAQNQPIEWSDYQGDMNWKDANAKCKSLKMRLPNLNELKSEFATAYESGAKLKWGESGGTYWSKTLHDYNDSNVFQMNVLTGNIYSYGSTKDNKTTNSVRCVSYSCSNGEIKRPKVFGEWSEFLGAMNWKEAKKKCYSIGMRLPSKKEGLAASIAGATVEWRKYGKLFWTTESFMDSAFAFPTNREDLFMENQNFINQVRCIR